MTEFARVFYAHACYAGLLFVRALLSVITDARVRNEKSSRTQSEYDTLNDDLAVARQRGMSDATLRQTYFGLVLSGGSLTFILAITLCLYSPHFQRGNIAPLTSICISRTLSALISSLLCGRPITPNGLPANV